MKKYLIKRIILSIITLFIILLILFLLVKYMPGTPFNDEKLSIEQKNILYNKYGLDKPIIIQLYIYIKNVFLGDFGNSYNIAKNIPINLLIKTRLPISIIIGGSASLIGSFLGIHLGIISAIKKNKVIDKVITIISVLGISVPAYVFAIAFSYIFGCQLKFFPIIYQNSNPIFSSIIPIITLSIFSTSTISRFTRNETLKVMKSDYIIFAESLGLEKKIIKRRILKNVLIPIITIIAPITITLITDAVVVEQMFSIQGVGNLLLKAIQSNDYNVIVALAFVFSALYIIAMLIVDIIYGFVDPRIRLSEEKINE